MFQILKKMYQTYKLLIVARRRCMWPSLQKELGSAWKGRLHSMDGYRRKPRGIIASCTGKTGYEADLRKRACPMAWV
jgi:hypothetical protein